MIDPQQVFLSAIQSNISYWLGKKANLLNNDQPNIKRLVTLALPVNQTSTAAVDLIIHNLPNIQQAGQAKDWLALLTQHACQHNGLPPASLIRTLNTKGQLEWISGNYPASVSLHKKALYLARQANLRRLEADALFGLCQSVWAQQDYPRALVNGLQAKSIMLENQSPETKAAMLDNMLGMIHFSMGDIQQAGSHFELAIYSFHEEGNETGEARAGNNLAAVFTQQREYKRALSLYGRSATILSRQGNISELCQVEISRGLLHMQLGRRDNALAAFERAIPPVNRGTVSPSQQGWLYLVKGYCALSQQDWEEAQGWFEKSLLEWRIAGNEKMQHITQKALESLPLTAPDSLFP